MPKWLRSNLAGLLLQRFHITIGIINCILFVLLFCERAQYGKIAAT